MARQMDPTFVPTTTKGAGPAFLALEQIPDEVKAEVEAIYAGLKTNPTGRMRVGFDTKEELSLYELQVKSYCALRTDGELRFRRSPTRGLPETYMDFRITDMPQDEPAAIVPNAGVGVQIPAPATPPVKSKTSRR